MDDNGDSPDSGTILTFPAQDPSKKPARPRPGGRKAKRYHDALMRGDFEEAKRLKPGRVTAEIRAEVIAKGMPDPMKVTPYKPKTAPTRPHVMFTQAIADEVCRRVLNGEPLAYICDDPNMPDYTNVWRWEKADEGFRQALAVARRDGSNYIADDCLRLADDLTIDPAHKRVMVETRLRLIKAWAPKIYGDQMKLTDADGSSVKFVIQGLHPEPDKAKEALDITPRKE